MKKVTIVIETTNAAFEDAPSNEVARILKELASRFGSGIVPETLRDFNGNKVGTVKVKS